MRPVFLLLSAALLLSGCAEPYQPPAYTFVPSPTAPPTAIPLNGGAYPGPPPSLPPDPALGTEEPASATPAAPEPLNSGEAVAPDIMPPPADTPEQATQGAVPAPPAVIAPPQQQAQPPAKSDIPLMGFRPLRGKSSASP